MPKGPVDRGYAGGGGIGAMGIAVGKAAMSRVARKSPVNTASMRAAKKVVLRKTPPKTLYHGTANASLKSGDRLTSGSSATTSYKFAESYAKGRGSIVPQSMKDRIRPRVLAVKPSRTTVRSPKSDTWKKKGGDEYTDRSGFVVKGDAKPPRPSMTTKPKPRNTVKKKLAARGTK